jgi:hypothetical protein
LGLNISKTNWWETDTYTVDALLAPQALNDDSLWGPQGPALVRAYEGGSTQAGWGLTPPQGSDEGFMARYLRGEFLPRRTEYGYDKGSHAAALVMRSTRLVCVDIDGKNGGLEHAGSLGALPLTLAETSKSGNGYHLFYAVPEQWTEDEGFGLLVDAIGIVTGVDIRAVGCVYHYPTQRWNEREVAEIPDWFLDKLLERKQRRAAFTAQVMKLDTLDETEILIMHAELLDELAKPIPQGKRNTTLFAIGHKLKAAGVPGWEGHLTARADDLGLSSDESDRIVQNIGRYDAP